MSVCGVSMQIEIFFLNFVITLELVHTEDLNAIIYNCLFFMIITRLITRHLKEVSKGCMTAGYKKQHKINLIL